MDEENKVNSLEETKNLEYNDIKAAQDAKESYLNKIEARTQLNDRIKERFESIKNGLEEPGKEEDK